MQILPWFPQVGRNLKRPLKKYLYEIFEPVANSYALNLILVSDCIGKEGHGLVTQETVLPLSSDILGPGSSTV